MASTSPISPTTSRCRRDPSQRAATAHRNSGQRWPSGTSSRGTRTFWEPADADLRELLEAAEVQGAPADEVDDIPEDIAGQVDEVGTGQ